MTNRRIFQELRGPLAALALLLGLVGNLFAQSENLPPKPDRYITDQAGVLDAGSLSTINAQLEQFEKETSNQIVVAIYPSLPPDAELYQYCTNTAQSWGVGQKGKDNGIVLFIFANDHKLYIAVGTGLQGAVTDALSKDIQTQVINPYFRQGDYAGGIEAGITALIAATKGEYKGTGSTIEEGLNATALLHSEIFQIILIIVVLLIVSRFNSYSRRGMIFTSGGYGIGGGWGGGSFGGGGGFGGGGFSGGGGNFSGGGAGGSW